LHLTIPSLNQSASVAGPLPAPSRVPFPSIAFTDYFTEASSRLRQKRIKAEVVQYQEIDIQQLRHEAGV